MSYEVINQMTKNIFQSNKAVGWWTDEEVTAITTDITLGGGKFSKPVATLLASKLALCHSELSEALEGMRKGLMDDHLPHRSMFEVELADTVIRIFDLAGFVGMDLGGAVIEKFTYNQSRADHKLANREAAGGKTI